MLVKMQPSIYFFYRFDLLIQEIKIKSSFAKITVTKPKKKTMETVTSTSYLEQLVSMAR
jgi:hypothetical protein